VKGLDRVHKLGPLFWDTLEIDFLP
jgi:CspA family cold shock protein